MPHRDGQEEVVIPAVFASGTAVYDRKTTIHHWQLRDLISAAENEHQFYLLYEQDVYRYDAAADEVIANLEFNANSMTYRRGYLAAGGLHGELEVRHLGRREVCFRGTVGNTVNNALHVGKHSEGEERLFVCCNDATIKVYSLPAMRCACVVSCPCPINYAALSPDGTSLLAVGDAEPTMLYKATPAGYTALTSFTEADDVGMCCAWNQFGTLLASCHQDGVCAVWDARSGSCVARMQLPSAARCLKFSAAPLDLLAISEHEERVSLVDARQWTRRQTVSLNPTQWQGGGGSGLDVSGVAFTPTGRRLWVGLDSCCMSVDIDDLKRRVWGSSTLA